MGGNSFSSVPIFSPAAKVVCSWFRLHPKVLWCIISLGVAVRLHQVFRTLLQAPAQLWWPPECVPFSALLSELWILSELRVSSCSVQTSNFKDFIWAGLVPRWYLGFRELWISGLCCTLAKKPKFSMENWLCMCNFVGEYNFQMGINHEAHLGFEGAQGISCARENPFWGKAGGFSMMSKAPLKNEKQSQHFV